MYQMHHFDRSIENWQTIYTKGILKLQLTFHLETELRISPNQEKKPEKQLSRLTLGKGGQVENTATRKNRHP